MPWRTVLEVAGSWRRMGHEVTVFSGDGVAKGHEVCGVRVVYVDRPKQAVAIKDFVLVLLDQKIESLYFPIAPGRFNFQLVHALKKNGISLVWYFPGAWYTRAQIAGALKVMPWSALVPYFIQAWFPKRIWASMLRFHGDLPIITMTPFTARRLVACGYPVNKVYPVFPGKSPVAKNSLPISESCQKNIDKLVGKRYFLFFGPPNAIRGILHILQAFQQVALNNSDSYLVCLFRKDENITDEPEAIHNMIKKTNFRGRLITQWESVNSSELDWFLENCFAVLKPFIIVPSEIPLAVIETAEYAKPVIGFSGDGTGEFVADIGVAVKRFSSPHLAEAMLQMLSSSDVYKERCEAARQVYNTHVTWKEVAQQWLKNGGDKSKVEATPL